MWHANYIYVQMQHNYVVC